MSGLNNPAMSLTNVDLPEPVSPIIASLSFLAILKVM
jgi:hypothetical protein